MPDSSTLALFVIAAITFNLSIGPNALYVMSRSVSQRQVPQPIHTRRLAEMDLIWELWEQIPAEFRERLCPE